MKFSKKIICLITVLGVAGGLTACNSKTAKNDTKVKSTVTATTSKDNSSDSKSTSTSSDSGSNGNVESLSTSNLPAFNGKTYVTVNNNEPSFTKSDLTTSSWEKYSDLDSSGRVRVANANIGKDIMPTAKRGPIGMVKPTGWQTAKYDFVDGKYLYNRSHLVGFQLAGENANPKNLMTGTRYMNVQGMLPFENMIADYVKETKHHVRYRVTPIFVGNELVARGVQMEARSVEDDGAGVKYNVYVFNNEPGVKIDYATGKSSLSGEKVSNTTTKAAATTATHATSTKPAATTQAAKSTATQATTNASTVDANGKGLIKGNVNAKGEKIYHMPNSANYAKTHAEQYFKTEQEAINAGFRKSKV